MRKILKKAVLCAAMAVLVWGCISVMPQKAMADEQTCDNYVYDYLDLLTDREENKLNEYIKEYADNGMPVFIVTQEVVGGSQDIEQETYDISELFYKDTVKGMYGIADALVITTCYRYKSAGSSQYYDRYADVSGQGNLKLIFSDYDCENIFNSALGFLKEENFLDAYVQMIAYADEIKSGSGIKNRLLSSWWVYLLAGAVCSAVTVGVIIVNTNGTSGTNSRTYMDTSRSLIKRRHDIFIRSTVSKVAKPKDNGGSSGHSGGHSSHSGGGSHGGGRF